MADIKSVYQSKTETSSDKPSSPIAKKIDVRSLFNQSGLLVKLFPELKIKKEKPASKISDLSKIIGMGSGDTGINSQLLKEISVTSRLSAKNSLVLPGMAYNIDMIRKSVNKMLISMGETLPSRKASIFFKGEDERESALESAMKKAGVSKVTGALPKPGAEGKAGEGLGLTDIAVGAFVGELASKLVASLLSTKTLTTILTRILSIFASPVILGSLGVGLLATFLWNTFKKKEKEDEIDKVGKRGGLPGVLAEADKLKKLPPVERAYEEIKDKERFTEDGKVNEAMLKQFEEKGKTQPEYAEAVKKYRAEKGMTAPSAPSAAPSTAPTPAASTPAAPSPTPSTPSKSDTKTPEKVTSAAIPSGSGLPIDYKSYAEKVGEKESGGNYKAVNTLGYLGKYQFGALALQDMGLVKKGTSLKGLDDPNNWNIQGGKQAFLSNAQLQEDTMLRYTKQNFATLNRIGVINGDSSPQDVAGYLAASHLLGPGGAKQLAQGKAGTDAYGTSSATYFKVGSATQQVEAPITALASSTTPSSQPSSSSSGSSIASTSTAVADAKMAATTPSQPSSTVIDNSKVTNVASAAPDTKSTSVYDEDLVKTLIASSYSYT